MKPADPTQAEREFQECCPCRAGESVSDYDCGLGDLCRCKPQPDDDEDIAACLWPGHATHARAVLAARLAQHDKDCGRVAMTCDHDHLHRELAAMEAGDGE